jgi:hypothetical protein
MGRAGRKGGATLLPRTKGAEDFSQVMPEADPPGRRIQSPGSTFSLRDASKEV